MKPVSGFEALWRNDQFTKRLLCITIDEGHCISRWGGFCPEYRDIGRLRYMLPRHVRFYVASATMPRVVIHDVMGILHVRKEDAFILHRSNDRPNVRLTVRQMLHPANSFLDLAFLIPEVLPDGWKPPKFLIFFDNIGESIRAGNFLRNRLPMEKKSLVKWFNSDMSDVFREDECEELKAGRTWGLTTTDSFGMVAPIPPARVD
jgi:superfamily II DNA helicase RecQ